MKRLLVVAAFAFLQALCAESALAQDPYMGEIRLFGSTYCPQFWAPANGAILAVADYPYLFALYLGQFGGDGKTTFALPNLAGSVPVGSGGPNGPSIGQTLPSVSTGANQQFGGLALTWCVALQGVYPTRQ